MGKRLRLSRIVIESVAGHLLPLSAPHEDVEPRPVTVSVVRSQRAFRPLTWYSPADETERVRLRNLFIWYLPQAAFFGLGFWFATSTGTGSGLSSFLFGVMLAAAYTGGANLVLNLWGRLRRRSGLQAHSGQPGGDSLSLTGARRSLSETPEHRKRVGVGD